MSVRLIAGRAGSGKTHWCQAQVCETLRHAPADGPRLIMLVPEQAALQVERGLIAMLAGCEGLNIPEPAAERKAARGAVAAALGRCEVLSFRRLAHRILNDTAGPAPAVLTPIGRQMALRRLIQRHRKDLREFAKVAERGTFVAALARGIAELLQESVSIEQLDAAAQAAEHDGDPAAARLHDSALLYRAYLDYLGSQRVDPEGVLDLARTRLAATSWLSGACLWIDGFAGLTQQQVRMIVSLAQRAAQVNIALLVNPEPGRAQTPETAPDDFSLFARTERTWFMLARSLHEVGVGIEEPVSLGCNSGPRFKNAAALARIEQDLFAVPTAAQRSTTLGERHDLIRAATVRERFPQTLAQPLPHGRGSDHENSKGIVRLVTAPDRRAEVAAAIRTLVDLVQRPDTPMRYRDIAVVVRDLTPYHDLLSAALRANGIPFFIDRRRPTHHHPLVQLIRSVLAIQADAPFDQAVAAVLKSGLSGLGDSAADALENYVLAHGLTAPEAWREEWKHRAVPGDEGPTPSPAATSLLAAVNASRSQLLERFGEWWPDRAAKYGQPACRTWAERLYGLLDRLGVREALAAWCGESAARGELDEAEEHEQVWSDLVKLLDELVETLGAERMTGRQFREVLESGLAGFTLGLVPATLDQVLVSSIERSRHPPVRAVFVLGFEDGLFPARPTEETIFGDLERNRLDACGVKLGRTGAQQLLDERMLAYIAFTRPSEFLWVSRSESDESGRATTPSPYWRALQAVLPEVPLVPVDAAGPAAISTNGGLASGLAERLRAWCEQRASEPESAAWLALYEWVRAAPAAGEGARSAVRAALSALSAPAEPVLSAASTERLWPPPHRTSVTRLERFAWCPFQHFASAGLRLEQRALHELAPLHMGQLYHTILEQFVNELMETGRTLHDLPDAEIAANLLRLSQLAVPALAEQVRLEDGEKRKAVWRSGKELPPALAGQRRGIGATPLRSVATERAFGGGGPDDLPALELHTPAGRTILLRGKIDRVDVLRAGEECLAVVLDYKRSLSRRLRLDEVYHGLALQLLAYLLVLRDHGEHLTGARVIPGGAFYVPLLGDFASVDHPTEADKEAFNPYASFKPRGVVDFDWIDRLDPKLETGWSSVFSVYRTKEGKSGLVDKSDAVNAGALRGMLDHVQQKMGELADGWLSGDISVAPARLGRETPCARCLYRSVCRYEYNLRQARALETMARRQVLEELSR